MTEPHWVRGYRCHGYWLNGHIRVGFIGLPLGRGEIQRAGYGWYYEPLKGPTAEGTAATLRVAKKTIENLYKKEV